MFKNILIGNQFFFFLSLLTWPLERKTELIRLLSVKFQSFIFIFSCMFQISTLQIQGFPGAYLCINPSLSITLCQVYFSHHLGGEVSRGQFPPSTPLGPCPCEMVFLFSSTASHLFRMNYQLWQQNLQWLQILFSSHI